MIGPPMSGMVGLLAAVCLCGAGVQTARAADYLLAIGGGPDASHNEASLEANMRYLQRALDHVGFPSDRRHILFADGGDSSYSDLQYLDAEAEIAPLNRELALLYDSLHEIGYRYRPSEVPNVAGPATAEQIDRWFDTHADALEPGDRLILYFTGHGGSGSDQQPRQTSLWLWNDEQMRVSAFVERLDRLHPQVDLVLVMVQCYSGGFADVIYENGDEDAEVAVHRRAGFYAAPHDRVAAGCTPSIDEGGYEDYSTHFIAAATGIDRLGNAVTDADLDDDGTLTFAEAHAYVLLQADTIDIPTTTSAAFVRRHSRMPGRGDRQLINPDREYHRLQAVAEPHHLAVLEGLSEQFDLHGSARIRSAKRAIEQMVADHRSLNRRYHRAQRNLVHARDRLKEAVVSRYPQLDHRWQPGLAEAIEAEAEGILRYIESHPEHAPLWEAVDELEELDGQMQVLSRRIARYHRLVHVAETVALAANLEHVADEQHVHRYRELVAMETKPLFTPPADEPSSADEPRP